jgi:hypothetical protein
MKISKRTLATMGIAASAACGLEARADLIFSNFDKSTEWNAFWYFIQDQPATDYESAVRFEPAVSFVVDALEVPVVNPGDEPGAYWPDPPPGSVFGDSMRLAIYLDDNGTPGQLLESVEAPDSVPPWGGSGEPLPPPTLVEFAGTTRLEKGQVYWIGVIEADGSVVGWQAADSIALLQRRARVADGPVWGEVASRRLGLRVYGTPLCDADTNGDGDVNADDLVTVILGWGPCPTPPEPCPGDVVASGGVHEVNTDDLIAVILSWGPCK